VFFKGLIAEEGTGVYGGYQGQAKNTTSVTPGLEVAVANLQDYCNGKILYLFLTRIWMTLL